MSCTRLLAAIVVGVAAPAVVAFASPPQDEPRPRGATPEEDATYRHPTPVRLEGTVVDETGAPIPSITVVACGTWAPCSPLYAAARLSARPLDELLRDIPVSWPADSFAKTTTDANGRWTATVRGYGMGSSIVAVTTAPGRDVVLLGANHPTNARAIVRTITLPKVASLDVGVRCKTPPCSDQVVLQVEGATQLRDVGTTHLERLLPGAYQISVIQGFGKPGEHRGVASVTVHANRKNKLTVHVARAGTGKRITGTAQVRKQREIVRDQLSITARCGATGKGGVEIVRTATTDASGSFALDDVGPAPCRVQVSSGFKGFEVFETPGSDVVVDKLPASGISINATAQPTQRGDE